MVAYNNKKYYIDIIETKPASAISIIETDCEVDFAPPLDYKEPEKPVASFPAGKSAAQGEYFSFCFTMSFWYCCGFFYTLMESECATCFSRVICHTNRRDSTYYRGLIKIILNSQFGVCLLMVLKDSLRWKSHDIQPFIIT
jgi:hypothetical protein